MATLSRQHFEGIADALHYSTRDLSERQRAEIVGAIADEMARHNGGFRRETFSNRVATGPYRWVVVENTPGYMPESDPAEFASVADARAYARDLAETARDEGYRVTGSASSGRYDIADPGTTHDLGRVIEIIDRVTL